MIMVGQPSEEVVISKRKDREVKKKILKTGDPYIFASEGSQCKIKIWDVSATNGQGKCDINGDSVYLNTSFDGNTVLGEAFSYLDIDIEHCLETMLLGEICEISLTYLDKEEKLALKVECKIEVLDIQSEQLVSDWPYDKLFEKAKIFKDKGVKLIKEHQICDAFRMFSKGLKFIIAMFPLDPEIIDEETIMQINDLRAKLYNNLAHCQLHYNEYDVALELCNKILDYDDKNTKARYRRCVAYMGLELWEEAYNDILQVLAADPNDKLAQQKFHMLKPKVDVINDKYNAVIKKMFK